MNAPNNPNNHQKQTRAGNAPTCANCCKPLHPKRGAGANDFVATDAETKRAGSGISRLRHRPVGVAKQSTISSK